MQNQAIESGAIAPAVGPFSPAVRAGDLVFVSGQVALDPNTGRLLEADVAQQTELALRNVQAVLAAAGKSLADVVKVSVFLGDMGDFTAMNAVYARHFQRPYPARTTIGVAALPLGAAVEIDCVAR